MELDDLELDTDVRHDDSLAIALFDEATMTDPAGQHVFIVGTSEETAAGKSALYQMKASRIPDRPDPPSPPERERRELVADFSAFYRDRLPHLIAYATYLGAGRQDALDIAQETMRKAFEKWGQVRDPVAWTRTVASRDYIDRATRCETPANSEADMPLGSPLVSDRDLQEFEARHDFLALIKELPFRQRQVLAWTYDGARPHEIAEALGLSAATVRSNLRHARDRVGRTERTDRLMPIRGVSDGQVDSEEEGQQ